MLSSIHVELFKACMTAFFFFFGNMQVHLSYLALIEIISEDICRLSAFLKEAGYELYLERKAW